MYYQCETITFIEYNVIIFYSHISAVGGGSSKAQNDAFYQSTLLPTTDHLSQRISIPLTFAIKRPDPPKTTLN